MRGVGSVATQQSSGSESGRPVLKLLGVAGIMVAGVLIVRGLGLAGWLDLENLDQVRAWLDGLGVWAPLAFLLLWVAACVLFLPGLPVTILGALVFGPFLGTVYSSIGATCGATAAFLIGRTSGRGVVGRWIERNEVLARIDAGVERQGWRMLMITRLVPLFPFNAQNYVYGVTRLSLATFVSVSFLCMLPGTLAFNLMAGSVGSGETGKFFLYLSLGAILFVLLSLVPGRLRQRGPNPEGR
jgi:uncharacterized membrane protein YdjX (TVP38/TMEM64 family)